MKLYHRYPYLCALWCGTEIFFFGGIIYGWGSLLFVLKEEGFYYESCKTYVLDKDVHINNTSQSAMHGGNTTAYEIPTLKINNGCPEQEAKLSLWFAIAVAFMYVCLAFLGQMTTRLGTQCTRHIFTLILVIGMICIAFASTEHPWLICPGLCGIGFAGIGIFATNIQVANLFPRFQSTVVACYAGLFDSSSVIQQIVKIAYENGISRRGSYIFLALLGASLLTVSSCLLLPKSYITRQKLQKYRKSKDYNGDEKADNLLSECHKEKCDPEEATLRMCLQSPTYIIHVMWMSVNVVLFVTFIGLLNVNLTKMSNHNKFVVGYYLGVFAYTTMCTVISGIGAGSLYDYLRRRYAGESNPARVWKPVLVPMFLTGLFGILVYLLLTIEVLGVMFAVFILFTMYRSFLYSIGIAFVNDAFPLYLFGPLYGIMTFVNGVFSMLQYAFFSWNEAYVNASMHVNICLIVLGVLTFIHPVRLWKRSLSAGIKSFAVNRNIQSDLEIQVLEQSSV